MVNEIRRQLGWSDLGIEVRAAATTRPDHATHLAWLRDKLGDRFIAGVVLYTGALSLPLGDRIVALPLSTLWEA